MVKETSFMLKDCAKFKVNKVQVTYKDFMAEIFKRFK